MQAIQDFSACLIFKQSFQSGLVIFDVKEMYCVEKKFCLNADILCDQLAVATALCFFFLPFLTFYSIKVFQIPDRHKFTL